jgi:TetR/AcrR family transcriptional regulator, cholesterol catabolism regulator
VPALNGSSGSPGAPGSTGSTASTASPASPASPGVGRTKSERTRERLLHAAAITLSRLGYAGMRLVDVGEEAGVQAPAIYYYWPSREQLIEEVVTVGTIRLREYVAAALAAAPPGTPALDRLDIAIDAHLRQLMSESAFAHAVIRNISQLPPAIRSRQIVEERKYAGIWRDLFADAVAAGELRSGLDPDLAQPLIIGILNWAAEWWSPKRSSIDTVVTTAQSIVRHGIASSGPSPS